MEEADIRKAQKQIGELLWLTTRTRPEICYAVSKCSHHLLSHPKWVLEQTEQIWSYLKNTPCQGLIFSRDRGEGWGREDGAGLEVFTDVSFAPGGLGTASHGCVMVMWNKGLLFWRSGRQGFPTLSTAEAELVETIEGITSGDSVEALLKEHEEWDYRRSLFTDNKASVSLLDGSATGWRTRHLRLRAEHLKWRLTSLEWRVRHMPGAIMPADLGTKVLPVQRLEELKRLMGMECRVETVSAEVVNAKFLKLVVMLSLLQRAKGDDGEGFEVSPLALLVGIYTLMVVLVTLALVWVSLWIQRSWMRVSSPGTDASRRSRVTSPGTDASMQAGVSSPGTVASIEELVMKTPLSSPEDENEESAEAQSSERGVEWRGRTSQLSVEVRQFCGSSITLPMARSITVRGNAVDCTTPRRCTRERCARAVEMDGCLDRWSIAS